MLAYVIPAYRLPKDIVRRTVKAIENERYDPSLPLAFAIGRLFELPVEDIFDDRGA